MFHTDPLSRADSPADEPGTSAPLLPQEQPTGPRVLVGPLGLRAGWGILLFAVLTGLLGTMLFSVVFRATGQLKPFLAANQQHAREAKQAKAAHQPPPLHPLPLLPATLSESTQLGGMLLAALGISFLERRRFAVYGLGLRHLRDAGTGAAWGLLAMALLIALLWSRHLLVFDGQLLHGGAMLRYGSGWLLMFVLVGLAEEFLFRGYLQFTLMRGLLGLAAKIAPRAQRPVAFALSALVWSGLFFVAHIVNAGETATGLAAVFLAGVVFSYALWRTGSLWWGIGAHATWDWAQSFLFGVPDSGTLSAGRLLQTHAVGPAWLSGGLDGPEGSVFVIAALLLLALAVRLHRPGAQPSVEPEGHPAFARSPA